MRKADIIEDAPAALSPCHLVTLSPGHGWRAWCYLVWLCIQRQARVRQMVWIALALLGLTATIIGLTTIADRWEMSQWRKTWVRPPPPAKSALEALAKSKEAAKAKVEPKQGIDSKSSDVVVSTYEQTATGMGNLSAVLPALVPTIPLTGGPPPAAALTDAIAAASRISLQRSGFYVFSNWIVFSVFVGFLLPIWSLSFATEALGGEREGRNLVWLLTRPLPRPSIYLAKFVALLPWSLGFNLGGFGLLCLLAGKPGHLAFRLYWPAVLGATLAFCALFHLMGACFRRAAVVALVYSFFLETILGIMPGYMKRMSISFYTRCLMFDAAADYGVAPEKPSIYLPVDGTTAWCVLLGVTVLLLVAGMVIFSRSEYQDLT